MRNRLKKIYKKINYQEGHGNTGWTTDQQDLYSYVLKWDRSSGDLVRLNDKITGFNRLVTSNLDMMDPKVLEMIKKRVFYRLSLFATF